MQNMGKLKSFPVHLLTECKSCDYLDSQVISAIFLNPLA